MSKVLIGITSRNRVKILPHAIEASLSQSYPNKEVAVYDDNSTDGTQALVEQYPQVSWHLSKEIKGYLFARNMFLENTDADYYCSLDDDSWFLNSEHLKNAVAYMDAFPNIGVLAFKILSPDPSKRKIMDDAIADSNNFIGCGHMVRVSAARAVGNYAVNPGFYGGEEKDLCIRLIDKGYSIKYFPSVVVWHDKTNVSRDLFGQHRSGVCNDLVFMWRRTPLLYLFPSIFVKLYRNLLFPYRYKNPKLLKPCLQGFADFFTFLFKGKVGRQPVTIKAFKKYLSFN
jgi:GT2 family glycosyltransferase